MYIAYTVIYEVFDEKLFYNQSQCRKKTKKGGAAEPYRACGVRNRS